MKHFKRRECCALARWLSVLGAALITSALIRSQYGGYSNNSLLLDTIVGLLCFAVSGFVGGGSDG